MSDLSSLPAVPKRSPKPSRNAVTLTSALAVAAGRDAANAQMRKAGRSKWSRADYNLACRTQAQLCLQLGGLHAVAAREILNH